MEALAESINQFMVSVSEELPRLQGSHPIFHETLPLPADLTITVEETERALTSLKVNKATGPDNIPAWVLRDFAHVLAKPLAAIFNSSLRGGILPSAWKSADVIPLPKHRPPASLESDLRPIFLTTIPVKVLESILVKRINKGLEGKVDERQFGSIAGCSTTDALVELTHKWFEATDTAGTYVRIVLVDYSKAFDLIDHNLLVNKLVDIGLPRHILRWMAAFLADRSHRVKLGDIYSSPGYPSGGVPQGMVTGLKISWCT